MRTQQPEIGRATQQTVLTLHNLDVLEGGGLKLAPSTLRDLFAGLALQGMCNTELTPSPDGVAFLSYEIADAMMKERHRRSQDGDPT